ncbi:AAA family ATPase [Streptomyces sp. bgisy084]|uniref:AAA family ATPase n=1 Tax=Streptomyces sp. bgisy084 TaxID=3413777 RepID=UPI003D72346C
MFNTIPERFRRGILLHLYKNLIPDPGSETPLILGIHGPSGQGKTYQCQKVLEEIDAHVITISGGELESVEAGQPAQVIRDAYKKCSQTRSRSGAKYAPTALVINDIDAAVGEWGELVQYTVNRQNVFGELMNLADAPTMLDTRSVKRVPIILTGNDFTKLYPPLVRAGRMHSFTWTPTLEERRDIVVAIFHELSPEECGKLIQQFPDQPIAFFSHLRSQIFDDAFWRHIDDVGVHEAFCQIAAGENPRINSQISVQTLSSMGKEMEDQGRLVNHLMGQ